MSQRTRRRRSRRLVQRPVIWAALAAVVVAACIPAIGILIGLPDRSELRRTLGGADMAYMEAGYAARGFRPVWVRGRSARPEAVRLVEALESSARDGLSPEKYQGALLKRRLADLPRGSRRERIRTELTLSAAYSAYVRDLHTPAAAADLLFTDPEFQPQFRDPGQIIEHLANAKSPREAFDEATKMSVLYGQMRAALERHRSTPGADAATEALLLVNLDRLRAIPGDTGERFVLVDAASNRLWLYEGDKPVRSMKVIVGTADQQTPQMAALIRYSIFNPFWNVPPDLARDTYAPKIRARPTALDELGMDPWSDFAPDAVRLDREQVDWNAVAAGKTPAWLRQRPGPQNAMGAVKFMLPNALGIYLHDTPERALFERDQRFFSAGCIRVEDAAGLSRWLHQGRVGPRGSEAEQRIDLPMPVPVYIVYLTATPENGSVSIHRDAYGRDRTLAPVAAVVHREAA